MRRGEALGPQLELVGPLLLDVLRIGCGCTNWSGSRSIVGVGAAPPRKVQGPAAVARRRRRPGRLYSSRDPRSGPHLHPSDQRWPAGPTAARAEDGAARTGRVLQSAREHVDQRGCCCSDRHLEHPASELHVIAGDGVDRAEGGDVKRFQ